ncbi:basic proline-rich protein-like [Meriones unguiculatus]|uniref:basic proline-rich protein-like n=1 Tax=Meriones unguiculatus TaxID=10047 RepID=UPI00293E1258|nr:basic proline-rich protein-like [Meriones unguiculatus]
MAWLFCINEPSKQPPTGKFDLDNSSSGLTSEESSLSPSAAGKGRECGGARGSPAAGSGTPHRFAPGRSGVRGAGWAAGGRLQPRGSRGPPPGLAEHCAKPRGAGAGALPGQRRAPGGPRAPSRPRAHSPSAPPGSRLRRLPAEPGRTPAAAAPPGGPASPAPPCGRPRARPPGRRSGRSASRPSRPPLAGPPGKLPGTLSRARPPQHPLPTLQLSSSPRPQRSPSTPPPGSLPCFAVPPYPRSHPSPHTHRPRSPVDQPFTWSKPQWWKGTQRCPGTNAGPVPEVTPVADLALDTRSQAPVSLFFFPREGGITGPSVRARAKPCHSQASGHWFPRVVVPRKELQKRHVASTVSGNHAAAAEERLHGEEKRSRTQLRALAARADPVQFSAPAGQRPKPSTPVLGDLVPSSGRLGHCIYVVHRRTGRPNTYT